MKRKRAKGAGRKARAGPTSPLTFRIPEDLRRELESEANGESVSERLIWHLRRSINRKRDEERDPALQGLLSLIARLALEITGGKLIPDKHIRSRWQSEWRTDLFNFRAFKVAVKKMLDTLEEPPPDSPQITEEEREKQAREAAEKFGPKFTKLFLEITKSPQAKGAWAFGNVWTRFTTSGLPYPEVAQRVMRDNPMLGREMEREDRDFRIAKDALELKPRKSLVEETLERLIKKEKLSPDMEASLQRISEGRRGPPTIEQAKELLEVLKRRKGQSP